VSALNRLVQSEPALHELDSQPSGFEWIDANDSDNSMLTFLRRGRTPGSEVLVVCNFTPVVRHDYQIGVPYAGSWQELLNSDSSAFAGTGVSNGAGVHARGDSWHGRPACLVLTVPPLAVLFMKPLETAQARA
jgi:1,4-alpha-glucan branching enzyme